MRAVEFESTIAPGGHIALPPEIAGEIGTGEQIRIVLMWDPSDSDGFWRTTAGRSFAAAYALEDAVYEHLMDDSSVAVHR